MMSFPRRLIELNFDFIIFKTFFTIEMGNKKILALASTRYDFFGLFILNLSLYRHYQLRYASIVTYHAVFI
jgi:hypothetical protein